MGDKTVIKTDFGDQASLPPGLVVKLVFLTGPIQGRTFIVSKRSTIIGRSKGDVILKDSAVSKEHVEIGFENGRLLVRDLNSSNGTLLNGGQVWEAFLNNNDEITMGSTVMRVEIKQSTQSSSWASLGGPAEEKEEIDDNAKTNRQAGDDKKDPLEGPLPDGVKAGLQVISGPDAGLKYVVKKRGTSVGRGRADVVLHDGDVSRKHFSIEFMSADRVIVKDLRSLNGTFVNQKWTSITNIKNGDMVQAGNSVIKIYISEK